MSLEQHRSAVCSVLPVAAVGVTRPSRRRKPRARQPEEVCWDNGQTYEVGAEWSDPGVCNLKTCRAGGVVEVQRCPYPDIPEGCSLGQPQLGQTFPYCCPKADCSFRRRSSSSSSSSSTSSSDDPDKYEDLDDDDGDDGGDMTMDFTLMGVDQEAEVKGVVKKITEPRETTGHTEAKLKQQKKDVTPVHDKHVRHEMDKYRVERCTDRREITETFRIIKDRSTHGQMTSYNELKETEPKLNLNKGSKDTDKSKETVEINKSNSTEIKSDKNAQQTDPSNNSVKATIVNDDALIINKHEDTNTNLQRSNDAINETNKSSQNEQPLEKGTDKCTGQIKDIHIDVDKNALKIDHSKYPEQNHNTTTNIDGKDVIEVVKNIDKFVEAEDKLSINKNSGNSNHEATSSNTDQQVEKGLNGNNSINGHSLNDKEINHQDLKTTDAVVPQIEVMSKDTGDNTELDKIHSEGSKTNQTSEHEINHKLSMCAENKIDLENGNTVTDISEKVSLDDDKLLRSLKEPQMATDESSTAVQPNNNLSQEVGNVSTKEEIEANEKIISNKIVMESDKFPTDIQENKTITNENFRTHDFEDKDSVSVKSDKIDSFIDHYGTTCSDKTLSLEVTYEDSSVIKETNMDMKHYGDDGAKLKEAIEHFKNVRGTYEELLNNEGKLDCWEGKEKVTQETQADHDKLCQELGPDREFEKIVENVKQNMKLVNDALGNENTNCSEGLEEYYKHVDLRQEDAKFNLEPAESIIPDIERLQELTKLAKGLVKEDGEENIIDDEFTKYKATFDEELQTNPFARFELHPDDDKLQTLTEEQSEMKNEDIEESYQNSGNFENYQYESTENIADSAQTQFSEEPPEAYHDEIVANESLAETTETLNPTADNNEEHFHTTIDIGEDILGYNQAVEPESTTGENDFNFTLPEDLLMHSVDGSQESNPVAMMSDGPMSGSADTDRFAPSLEAEEEEDEQDDQFAAEAHA